MKKLITIGLLFISNVIYSQSIQIINDDDFTFKSNNQSFVLFKIRVNDYTDYYTSEQVVNNHFQPVLSIYKYDNVLKKWDSYVNTEHYIHRRMKGGTWKKINKLTVYEWTYLLEVNPNKDGRFFEYFTLRNSSYKPITIPIFRTIAPENNKLYNYGTIDITINQPNREPFVQFFNNNTEKENLINYVKKSYPNIYNAYNDKVSDEKFKFLFAIMTVGELNLKSTLHYWTVNNEPIEIATDKSIEVALGTSIRFNSKTDKSPKTYITFSPQSYNS